MITQLFNKNILKVLTVFSISQGSRFQRNDLKEKIRMNNVNLDNALNLLLAANVIKKEKRYYSLNLEDKDARTIISLISEQYRKLKELPLNVYFALTEVIYSLSKFELELYLFGSYSKLVFKEKSDIDLAVISDKLTSKSRNEISKVIRKLERKYGKNIQFHYFSKKFYKNKKDPLVKEILKNGVKLM